MGQQWFDPWPEHTESAVHHMPGARSSAACVSRRPPVAEHEGWES